jgi:hypothetical protein
MLSSSTAMIPRFASRVRSAGRGLEMITLESGRNAADCARAGLANRLAVRPRTNAERFFMDGLRNGIGRDQGESAGILSLLGFQIKGKSWLL